MNSNNYVEPIALWIFVNELHFSKTLRQLLSNKKIPECIKSFEYFRKSVCIQITIQIIIF